MNEVKTTELEINASAVSGMVVYFLKDLKFQMKYVCSKVENLDKKPQLDELENLYNMFVETGLPVLNVGFIKTGF